MRRALIDLGYIETYHGFAAAFECPWDCIMWREALEAKFRGKGKKFCREEWDMLLGHCQAVTDAPAMCFGPELIEAYPDAKVILTTRDIDKWYASMEEAVIESVFNATGQTLSWLNALTLSPFRYNSFVFRSMLEDFWHTTSPFKGSPGVVAAKNKENAQAVFRAHYALIKSLVPEENLLEFRVEEGWKPLCKFLDKEIPSQEFPVGNAKKDLQARIDAFTKESLRLWMWKGGVLVGIGAMLWAVLRWT